MRDVFTFTRVIVGLASAALWGLCALLLAEGQCASSAVTRGMLGLGIAAGLAGGLFSTVDDESRDRWFFVVTVVLLLLALLAGVRGLLEPLVGAMLRTSVANSSLVSALASPLARLLVAPLVIAACVVLIGYSAGDLGLRASRIDRRAVRSAVAWSLVVMLVSLPGARASFPATVALSWIAEEFFYRGFLLPVLRDRIGFRTALAAQAVVYAFAGALAPSPDGLEWVRRLVLALAAGLAARAGGSLAWSAAPRIAVALVAAR